MATRRIPPAGLTPDSAALVLTPAQQAALELQELEAEDDTPQTPADRIAVMLDQYSDAERCKVALYKITGPNEFQWLSDYAPEQFEASGLEGIRSQFGPGKFQVRLYATQPGSNRFVVRMKENIDIGALINSPTIPAQSQASGDIAGVLRMLAEGQQKLFDMLANKPAADPMEQMKSTLGLMTMMREAMGLNQQAPQKSNLTEILETVRELRGVADELNPKPEPAADPDNPMSMLPQILELVKVGMSQQAPNQPQTAPQFQPVRLPAGMATATQTPVDQPPQPTEEENAMNFALLGKLKSQLSELVAKAAANADVQESAEWLADEIPDEFIEALFADDWWQLLSAVAPEVLPHQEWFAQVRDATLPLFDDEETHEDAPASAEDVARIPVLPPM